MASLTCQGENYNCTLPQADDRFYLKKKKKEMGQLNVSSTGQASFVTKCPKHFLGLNCAPVCRDKHKGAAMGNMRFFQLHNSVEVGRKTVRL